MKNLPQCYNYSSNNAISLLKQAKCCNICSLENFKKSNEITFSSDSLPADFCVLTTYNHICLPKQGLNLVNVLEDVFHLVATQLRWYLTSHM